MTRTQRTRSRSAFAIIVRLEPPITSRVAFPRNATSGSGLDTAHRADMDNCSRGGNGAGSGTNTPPPRGVGFAGCSAYHCVVNSLDDAT